MLISSSLHQYRTAPSYAGQCPDKDSASFRARPSHDPQAPPPLAHAPGPPRPFWPAGPGAR
jgi:hypothetical protein